MSFSFDPTNNKHLRDLLQSVGIKTAAALTLFNRERVRAVTFSTWISWTASPDSRDFAPLPDDELAHAQRAFADLLMPC